MLLRSRDDLLNDCTSAGAFWPCRLSCYYLRIGDCPKAWDGPHCHPQPCHHPVRRLSGSLHCVSNFTVPWTAPSEYIGWQQAKLANRNVRQDATQYSVLATLPQVVVLIVQFLLHWCPNWPRLRRLVDASYKCGLLLSVIPSDRESQCIVQSLMLVLNPPATLVAA